MTPRAARGLTTGAAAVSRAPRLGERLRQLRVAAGLTQTDLAGDRFSKEYISQLERGKTRPTVETTEWLALRLGVDAGFLQSGVAADERSKAEAIVARADALLEEHQLDEAVQEYTRALPAVLGTGAVELHVRALNGEGMARAQSGDVRGALALLAQSRTIVERDEFSDIDRAEVLYRLGVCRYMLSSISTAVGLFNEALTLAERSGLPCDQLRLEVFAWRSRCYRRQRDYEAAREDVEHALELAEAMHDARALGRALLMQERLDEAESALGEAEDAFSQLSSASHRAAAWIAQGDLATRRGDERRAAVLYRQAAEALQDFRF